ncbi:ATP-binding protein [Alishewanella tabrizica]|uniref:histidine kinase n=1 Tax=Alishewanella tabrizica TaxID=671278 RepID=A0ABQ2WIA3_9ALTE|nr:ATP-binding protein [Alishewanella tabrizica]GGW53261.1 hypothetical protein GCM10008111_06780 [Alishewanella tabrizica]
MKKILKKLFIHKFFFLLAFVVVFIFVFTNIYTQTNRKQYSQALIADIYRVQQTKQQLLQQQAERHLKLAVNLIATDQQLSALIYQAATRYQQAGINADLVELREAIQPILNAYWRQLEPFGASQLHLHLAPDAFTLLRAHRPDRHSDILKDIRPMIVTSLTQAQPITATELGRHGLGLRSVVPLLDHAGNAIAAIEVGFNLQNVFTQNTGHASVKFGADQVVAEHIELLVMPKVTAVLHQDTQASWYVSQYWHAPKPSEMLIFWLENDLIPAEISEATQLILPYEDRMFALSLLPWPLWGSNEPNALLVSLSWQDISQQISAQHQVDRTIELTWLITLIAVVLISLSLMAYFRRQAKQEMNEQQLLVKKSEQKLSALYQLSPLPILLNRFSDGAFVEANPAMETLIGYTPEELSRLSYWDLTPECYAQAEQLQLKSLTDTGRYGPYFKQYKHKNGELIDIELNGVLFNDGTGESYIWTIIKDIRDIKRVERLKDDFVSTVSHELRTPLTSIAGSLGLVLGGAGGELSPKAEKLLSIAHKNSQRLNLLINDLLDIDKLMAGKMRFSQELVSLPKLLEDTLEQNQPYARQHQVTLNLIASPRLYLWIDSARIQQVLANFISNAIKFSPINDVVVISAEQIDDRVRIAIKDNGPGIKLLDQHRLFKRFSQLEQYEQSKGGTGLGLAISREIIIHSGGDVGVNSVCGEGATFWFELPIHQLRANSLTTGTILVVEDDKDTAELLCDLLKAQQYAAEWVADGKSAWQKLQVQKFAAITLDLKLKDESGADFFLKLRDNPATADIPVLIISAFIEKGKLQLSALANALDWIEKPVSAELLGLKLSQLLNQLPRLDRYHKILHIEDDNDIVTIMRMQLEGLCEYHAVASLSEARIALSKDRFELVLLDLGLPDGDGMSLLPSIVECQGEIPVVIFSAQDVSLADWAKVNAVFSKSRINTDLLARYLRKILENSTSKS